MINERAVGILLECILITCCDLISFAFTERSSFQLFTLKWHNFEELYAKCKIATVCNNSFPEIFVKHIMSITAKIYLIMLPHFLTFL